MTAAEKARRPRADTLGRRAAAQRLRSLAFDEASVSAYVRELARDGAPARDSRAAARAHGAPSMARAVWEPATA
jgi:hypothetical protein